MIPQGEIPAESFLRFLAIRVSARYNPFKKIQGSPSRVSPTNSPTLSSVSRTGLMISTGISSASPVAVKRKGTGRPQCPSSIASRRTWLTPALILKGESFSIPTF